MKNDLDYTTIGLFNSAHEAAKAITHVNKLGINKADISIIMHDKEAAKELGANTGVKVAKGTAAGIGAGAAVGALAGLAIGLSALVVPGFGPVLIAGPLAGVLGGTGAAAATGAATGAVSGGIIGALTGLGVANTEAESYETAVRNGDVLLAVATTHEHASAAEQNLQTHGGRDVKTVHKHLSEVHVKVSSVSAA